MKRILAIVAIISFSMCIAMTAAAAANPTPAEKAFYAAQHPKPRKRHARRAGTTIPYLKNSRPIHVRRLSARERRDVFRRLINIRID